VDAHGRAPIVVASSGSHKAVGPKLRKHAMNIRFPTLIAALAVFGLCVSVPAFAGKDKNCSLPDPHPSCGGGGGDGDSSPYYDVTVFWLSPYDGGFGGGGEYWTASNNGSVNYAPFDPDFLPEKTRGVLNLDFFQDYFDTVLEPGKGTACFPDTLGTSTVSLYPAGVSYKKSTGALARFWFKGYTHSDPPVEVLYLLSFFKGQLADTTDWPPESLDVPTNTMTWDKSSEWKLKPENEPAEIQADSCTRERGKFNPDLWGGDPAVSIDVTKVPKP
jgi:hypothetical protein